MRQLQAIRRVALILIMSLLVFGAGSLSAQEALGDELQVDIGIWERLEAVRSTLNESVVSGTTQEEVVERAQAAAALLLGDIDEPGLIARVQTLAGLTSEDLIDAEAVVTNGDDAPEIVALAHLLLAAEALTSSPDDVSLLVAAGHVEEAGRLLAHLEPQDQAAE